jgi:hypothetical protein
MSPKPPKEKSSIPWHPILTGLAITLGVLCQLGIHVPAFIWPSLGVPSIMGSADAGEKK